mmetsp:Transcript_44242/g.69185  ORF Transcript_44242/g.69185 Transcript_44242/m.69185 type:complete len:92 (+) Transcript_44242:2420-2695(+)
MQGPSPSQPSKATWRGGGLGIPSQRVLGGVLGARGSGTEAQGLKDRRFGSLGARKLLFLVYWYCFYLGICQGASSAATGARAFNLTWTLRN